MTFTPLRVRSYGSLLAGTASPEALVDGALERGHTALALTDRDNLYVAVRFLQAAARSGLRALPGAELTHRRSAVLLLAADRRGWAHLCALLTARRLDPAFDLVRAVAEHHAGLQVVAESPALAAALLAAGVPAAMRADDAHARPLARRTGLWLGVRGLASERATLRARLAQAWRLGVPAVATGDVLMLDAAGHEAHRVAVAAGAGELLERMPATAFGARAAWLAPPEEWERRVRAVCGGAGCADAAEELLANNAALAERCRCEVETGTPIFPRIALPPGVTAADRLRALAAAGLARRYAAGATRRAARARLERELALIEHMGFTDYFLLVADIVGFAAARGIPSVGRGSGASSMVSYLLGVTSVDPVRHGLCFERFLHPQRRDCPDLDVDLCWRRRDEVIAHVFATHGEGRVAMISAHATLGPRSAFREAARALGVPLPRVNALAKRLPRGALPEASSLEQALGAELAREFREPRVADALRLAASLAGAPRHLSVHCGGLVIGDRELTHYLPLERAAKGVIVSQFEMRAVEAIGLVKMDLLGNRAISAIGDCLSAGSGPAATANDESPSCVASRSLPAPMGCDPAAGGGATRSAGGFDPGFLPEVDLETAELVRSGDTLNVFQLESPAMRHLLRMLRAETPDAAIAAVALVRPGPAESGMKEAFCRRARGLESVAFPHERLRETLAGTHGVMLYEEDVMRVAAAFCGLPLAEGETLRRAIGKARDDEEFRFLERGFVAQAVRTGVTADEARAVWRELARFAGYAFCKAHAAGYGQLAWQAAWCKAHRPAAWAAAVLNHHAGMYPMWVHVEDLRRRGVTVLPPCANASARDSALVPGSPAGAGGTVRAGLHVIASLSGATADRLVAERARAPFASFADLATRARPTPPELESLVLAGALDWTGRTRAALLLEARIGTALAARAGTARRDATTPLLAAAGLDAPAEAPRPGGEALPELPDFPPVERVRGEIASTGLWFSAHPLDVFVPAETAHGTVPAAELERHAGRSVAVRGLPCASRRVESKSGGHVLFVTLADRSGVAECVLFPRDHARLAPTFRGEVVRAEGRLDDSLGALTVVTTRAWSWGSRG